MPWWKWSQTANSNGNADSLISWPEGMPPSQVNDSARAMMAETAKYRDDIAGAIVTGGTSTAYTLASFSVYDTAAHLDKQMIAFSPHATNAAGPVTLNVDGTGAKALRTSPNTELLAGVLIQGTPYIATYNNADGAFYLQSFFGNPYNVPLGAGMDFWLPTAPNSSFVFPIGQAISRTTYAALFALMGTAYGVGDGSTTFNVPDKRGRVSAGMAFMGGSDSGRLSNGSIAAVRNTLGGAAGTDTHTITTPNLPAYTPTGTVSQVTGTAPLQGTAAGGSNVAGVACVGNNGTGVNPLGPLPLTLSAQTITMNAQGGTSTPIDGLQPTIVCNYILRVI